MELLLVTLLYTNSGLVFLTLIGNIYNLKYSNTIYEFDIMLEADIVIDFRAEENRRNNIDALQDNLIEYINNKYDIYEERLQSFLEVLGEVEEYIISDENISLGHFTHYDFISENNKCVTILKENITEYTDKSKYISENRIEKVFVIKCILDSIEYISTAIWNEKYTPLLTWARAYKESKNRKEEILVPPCTEDEHIDFYNFALSILDNSGNSDEDTVLAIIGIIFAFYGIPIIPPMIVQHHEYRKSSHTPG